MPTPEIIALAVLEIDGVTAALVAHDAALKRAPVTFVACAPVSPGKTVLVFHGDVACVQEALEAATAVAASRVIDSLMLAHVHPEMVRALNGAQMAVPSGMAVGIVECRTVAGTLRGLDQSLKMATVGVARMHLALEFGGKGFFILFGTHADVEAGLAVATQAAGDGQGVDTALVASPHPDLLALGLAHPTPKSATLALCC